MLPFLFHHSQTSAEPVQLPCNAMREQRPASPRHGDCRIGPRGSVYCLVF